jgi:hypothetical protein
MRNIVFVAIFILACLYLAFPSKVFACQQETLIIDGRVVVCSICGGVMVCDKEKIWKN